MLGTIRNKANRRLQQVKEKINKKLQSYFRLYRTYIVISILLGAGFKYGYDEFVSLIEPLLDTLHLSSMVPISVVAINNSYLFSTSAAILATVFTIIFVLYTVFVQMSGAHTSFGIFQSNETKNLMRLYFTTIVLSLMMLVTTFQFPVLILTLTFVCVLSLYPFLLNFSDKLAYDVGVGKLNEEITLLMDSKKESLALGKMNLLANTCKRSIQDNRIDAFFYIMEIFKTSILKAQQQEMVNVIKIIGHDYLGMTRI